MVHEQYLGPVGMKHQGGRGNMSGTELMPRKGRTCLPEQVECQVPALPREAVGAGIEAFNRGAGLFNGHCAGVFSSWSFVHARSGSSCSDFISASRAWAFWCSFFSAIPIHR